jgi:hypothetical protein
MRRSVKAAMIAAVAGVEIPDDGLPMTVFAEMLRCHPSDAPEVIKYLHHKHLIWKSERGGHIRVFPISMKPERGRPPEVAKNVVDPVGNKIVELLGSLTANFLRLRRLVNERPPGSVWTAEKFANDQAMIVEAEQIMRRVRRFCHWNPEITAEAIRDAMWLFLPDLMQRVAENQPELMRSDVPFSKPEERPTNIEANLSHDERVYRYVVSAGENGIAAYEIARKFGNLIDTAKVIDIANMLDNGGLIRVVEARKSGKGRKTARLFDAKFAPEVTQAGTFYTR